MSDDKSTKLYFQRSRLWAALALLGVGLSQTTLADTWDGGSGSADAACRVRLDESGAYRFSRAEINGNVAYCYMKPKDGEGSEVHSTSVVRDEPPPETQTTQESASNSTDAATQPDTPPAASNNENKCNYAFNKGAPGGGDPLSDLLCDAVSNNSPSFRVYPRRADGKLGSQLTEVDALRGNTWYECKCGYLSTVKGAEKGDKKALQSLEGPSGLDKKLRTQADVAAECGYDFNIVVANPIVAAFFRDRYSFAKVIEQPFEACE
jgi:hypothetical protein